MAQLRTPTGRQQINSVALRGATLWRIGKPVLGNKMHRIVEVPAPWTAAVVAVAEAHRPAPWTAAVVAVAEAHRPALWTVAVVAVVVAVAAIALLEEQEVG